MNLCYNLPEEDIRFIPRGVGEKVLSAPICNNSYSPALSHFDIALSKNYLFYLLFELFFPSHERLEFNDKSAY